jgi:hypothetical protein
MRRIALALAVATLALPASAGAGGWATVGIAPLPGDDIRAGDHWTPTLTVLQHGRTPLDGVQPTLTIRSPTTGATHTFVARPTGEPGRYAVDVRFPSSGTWAYEVFDDFSATHTFAPVTVGVPGGSGATSPWIFVLVAALAAVAVAATATLAVRRRRPSAATTVPAA